MGKAKTFGGAGVIVGAAIIVAVWLSRIYGPGGFLNWIIQTYIPVILVTIALIAIIIGILLLIYG